MVDSGGLLSRCTGLQPCTEGSNPSLSANRFAIGARRFAATLTASVLAASLLTGCVERFFRVETEPVGARVYINGEEAGVSPVERTFTYYGTMRVDVWLEKRPGVTRMVELAPPWYERFPFDLFVELLDPVTHVDRHSVTIAFPESPAASAATREDELRRRAEELRTETR